MTQAVTATDGLDYEIQTSVTFRVGSNTASCSIEIFDDDMIEITETFTILIGDVDNVRVDPMQSTATVSIIDDDRGKVHSYLVTFLNLYWSITVRSPWSIL